MMTDPENNTRDRLPAHCELAVSGDYDLITSTEHPPHLPDLTEYKT
jgi:hypothetical protein